MRSYSTLPAAAAQRRRLFSTIRRSVLKTKRERDGPVCELSGYLHGQASAGAPSLASPQRSPLLKVAQRAGEDVAGEGEYCMATINPLCGSGASLESRGRVQRSQLFI